MFQIGGKPYACGLNVGRPVVSFLPIAAHKKKKRRIGTEEHVNLVIMTENKYCSVAGQDSRSSHIITIF